MKIVKRNSMFFLAAALSFVMASAIAGPGQAARAESEQAMLVQAVVDLTELRDQITDRWTSLLKSGWSVYGDDKLIFSDLEKTPADFKPWLDVAPPGDRLKVESLTHILNRIPEAEKAFMASIHHSRSAAANCYLSAMPMITVYGSVRDQTDALALGREPQYLLLAPPESTTIAVRTKYGFDKDRRTEFGQESAAFEKRKAVTEGAVGTPLIAEPPVEKESAAGRLPRQEPSSDPEELRLAYETLKASQSMYYGVVTATYDVQLGLVEFGTMPAHFGCGSQALAELTALISRLPGLTEQGPKLVADLTETCTQMTANIKLAGEALAQKQRSQADLERLVESSLKDIDALRAYYLERLLESAK